MNKKIFIIVLFLSVTCSLSAQNNVDVSYRKDAEKLIGMVSPMAYDAMISPLKEIIPQEKYTEFEKEIKQIFPSFISQLTDVYMQTFSHDEIKEIIKFYETPVGKKMKTEMGNLIEKGSEIGRKWGEEKLLPILEKYVTE